MSSRKSYIILGIILGILLISGFVLFAVGGIVSVESRSRGFPVLVAVGFGTTGVGMVVCVVGCWIVGSRHQAQVRQAVANESMKYSTRSPPCSWRLYIDRSWSEYGRNRESTVIYGVSIYFLFESMTNQFL